MKSSWKPVQLGDLVDIQTGFPFKSSEYTTDDDAIPLLRGDNVVQGTFRWDGVKYWPKSALIEKHNKYWLAEHDVILAMDRPWIEAGLKTSQVSKSDLPCLLVQRVARLRSKKGLDQHYLRYLVSSYWFTEYVKQVQTGTAVPHISPKQIAAFDFLLPPEGEQKEIGRLLKSLDDKIELNRQMNETLEAMAQALFKSWFVDFDPVIDNALAAGNEIPEPLQARAEKRQALGDQRKPLPPEIQALFPERFVFNDEMGWIPEGWEQTAISDVAQVIKGKSYKSAELAASQTALVTLKSFNRGGGYRLDGLKEYTGAYKPEQEVTAGDLVIAYTDVTQAADVIGKPAMVVSDERYERLVISLDVAVVRPAKVEYKTFLYGLSQTEQFQQHTKSHSTGTTVLHLSKNAVPSYEFSAPDLRLIEAFDKQVGPLFRTIDLNISRVRTLVKARDTLLPKLLSGELRIGEAEKQVAEAV